MLVTVHWARSPLDSFSTTTLRENYIDPPYNHKVEKYGASSWIFKCQMGDGGAITHHVLQLDPQSGCLDATSTAPKRGIDELTQGFLCCRFKTVAFSHNNLLYMCVYSTCSVFALVQKR